MYSEFTQEIKKYKHVGVVSHVRPDGDCLGAQVALCSWLQQNGLSCTAFNEDDIPENLSWLQQEIPVQKFENEKLEKCDLFILVDGNSLPRFGYFAEWFKNKERPLWMIDHHPNPDDVFEIAISVVDASSTCELIYQLYMEHNPDQISEMNAKAMYTGIITDTGSLQFESVTPETVRATAELLERGGFRPNEVAERVFSNRSIGQMHLLSEALKTIRMHADNQIAVMFVTTEMLERTNTTKNDCEGFVNYPLNIDTAKAAILLKDFDEDGIRISFRSRSNVDVNEWANNFGGGGHKKAAGAWHPGPLEKAIEEIIEIGTSQLKRIEKTSHK